MNVYRKMPRTVDGGVPNMNWNPNNDTVDVNYNGVNNYNSSGGVRQKFQHDKPHYKVGFCVLGFISDASQLFVSLDEVIMTATNIRYVFSVIICNSYSVRTNCFKTSREIRISLR